MNRRHFLRTSTVAAAALAALPRAFTAHAKPSRAPRILLRNSWGSLNIGDIGHTPGALSLLEKHFPEAEITLWPGGIGHGAREMLLANYPRLRLAEGTLGPDGKPTTPELARAWAETDFYLSGSGSGFPFSQHAAAFKAATGKPVGIFGVSTDPISGLTPDRDPEGGTLDELRRRAIALPATHLPREQRAIIDQSAFFFCRDSISLEYLKAQGVKPPILEFGPDSQLGMHLRDDAKGLAYLHAHGLAPGKFICAIPRMRYTPYYRLTPGQKRVPTDDIRDRINDRTTAEDVAKLREMTVAYVRHTGNKVFVCPEMTHEMELGKTHMVDPLPADVKKHVVWRETYWLPDEAASVYAQAQCVVSMECHSPLIALHNGTPTFYVRQPTDTCKGEMYRDIGAGDWLFEIEQTSGQQLAEKLAVIHRDPVSARAQVRRIMAFVEGRQRRMVEAVRAAIPAKA